MRVQNLDKDINVIFKCDVLTHKKFMKDMTLKINPDGGKNFRTHPDRHWGPSSRLHDGYRLPFPEVNRQRYVSLTTYHHIASSLK